MSRAGRRVVTKVIDGRARRVHAWTDHAGIACSRPFSDAEEKAADEEGIRQATLAEATMRAELVRIDLLARTPAPPPRRTFSPRHEAALAKTEAALATETDRDKQLVLQAKLGGLLASAELDGVVTVRAGELPRGGRPVSATVERVLEARPGNARVRAEDDDDDDEPAPPKRKKLDDDDPWWPSEPDPEDVDSLKRCSKCLAKNSGSRKECRRCGAAMPGASEKEAAGARVSKIEGRGGSCSIEWGAHEASRRGALEELGERAARAEKGK